MAGVNEHSGHRSRLRDRVKKEGLENFQNYQVLEYALTFAIPYKDTNVIAHKLINKFGSFSGVLEADEEDIASVEGMGEVSAHFLANLLQIYNYYEKDKVSKKATIFSPHQAVEYSKKLLKGKFVEELYVICVAQNNNVEYVEKVSEGTFNQTAAPIRKIMDVMNKSKVSNIVIAHNHPKGFPQASTEDNILTKALVTSLCLSGCHLMDHVIVADDGNYYSYRESGVIDKYIESAAGIARDVVVAQPQARYDYEVKHDKK